MSLLLILFIVNLVADISCQADYSDLRNFIKSIEQEIILTTAAAENLYNKRCINNCLPSYISCSNILPNFSCETSFKTNLCSCSPIAGRMMNTKNSVIQLQNKNYPFPDINQQKVKEMICSFSEMSSFFNKINKSYTNTRWQYLGTYNGVHRTYPARDKCDIYDPRGRPWYVSASSGAKNLIIIIDKSGSMNENYKLDSAKNAAIAVIETLTIQDWFGIIKFSDSAVQYNSSLIRFKADKKDGFKNFINAIKADGSTNYEAAFRKAYDVLKNTKADELGSPCSDNIIMFLSDGAPTVGMATANELINLLNSLDVGFNSTLLSYSFGKDSDPEFMRKLSCSRKGVVQFVPNSEELYDAMVGYYLLLSSGSIRTGPVWVEPYDDITVNGIGKTTSVVMPIYDKSTNPPFLLGVYGVDIDLEEFYKYETAENVLKLMVDRSSICTKFSLNECQMESLRGNYKCGTSTTQTCSPVLESAPTCNNIGTKFNNLVYEGVQTLQELKVQSCCSIESICSSNNTGLIVGCVIGSIVLIAIIIYLIIRNVPQNNSNPPHANSIPIPAGGKPHLPEEEPIKNTTPSDLHPQEVAVPEHMKDNLNQENVGQKFPGILEIEAANNTKGKF